MSIPSHKYNPDNLTAPTDVHRARWVTRATERVHQLPAIVNRKTQVCSLGPGHELNNWLRVVVEIAERSRKEPYRNICIHQGSYGDAASASIVKETALDVKSHAPKNTPEDAKAQLRSALDLVSDNVAVLDTLGNIVMTNFAWQQFSLENSPQPGQATPHSGVGNNYLDVSSRCMNSDDESSQAVEGICDVLSGRLDGFCLRYPCHTPAEQYWFSMTVTPLEWDGKRGALVRHTDTTPRHRLQH